MTTKRVTWRVAGGVIALAIFAVAIFAWVWLRPSEAPPKFASGNGRIEAVEVFVATRWAGRVKEILVEEGNFVSAGQALARMDVAVLEAQRREAEARNQQAAIGIDIAQSQVTQREAERGAAQAVVAQREVESGAALRDLRRAEGLASRDAVSGKTLDDAQARMQGAEAALNSAKAQVAAAEAAVGVAQAQLIGARSALEAGQANLQRIEAEITDGTLVSPRDGRVQYRIAQPGEVLAAGGRVLSLLEVSDVYMTLFLPTEAAGRVALGSEVRLVLDAAPQYVIPARVSFVADEAQFTPKTVETQVERLKLMFRVKARVDPQLLREHIEQVKTGLPGVAHVKLDPRADWPPELQVKTPP